VPLFSIKSYLGRCLTARKAPAAPAVIPDCDSAADQAFGVEDSAGHGARGSVLDRSDDDWHGARSCASWSGCDGACDP
jgi:hypothetical protein